MCFVNVYTKLGQVLFAEVIIPTKIIRIPKTSNIGYLLLLSENDNQESTPTQLLQSQAIAS